MNVRAAVMVRPGKMEIRKFDYPSVNENSLVVKMEMSGVCGTDGHVYAGYIDSAQTKFPIIPGHENVGVVDKIGKVASSQIEVQGNVLSEGDRVVWSNTIPCGTCFGCRWLAWPKTNYCSNHESYGGDNCEDPKNKPWLFGGWADYLYIKPRTWVYKVPDNLPPEVTVLLDTLVSVRGVESSMSTVPLMREGFATQDNVVVQGAGPVGVMAAFRAKAMGAGKVIMVGAPKHRLELARSFGVDETIDIDEIKKPEEREQEVKTLTDRIGADLVIECAGAPQAVPEGIDMCRIGGTYILIGCHADRGTVGVNPSRIVQKELRLLGQNYASPQQYGRDLKILAAFADKYPFEKLMTHRFPIDEAAKAFQVQRNLESMKIALTNS